MFKRFVLLLLIAPALHAWGETYIYDYDDNCRSAYNNYLALHMGAGRAKIINEIKQNPYNLMATYVADYEDCIMLLMNCDQEDYVQRISHFDERIELLEKGNRSSPWYLFCKGGVYMHRALIYTRFGEQYKAVINFHRAFSLLKENKQLFPAFEYNDVFLGLQEAVLGSLPGNYKWMASIFGMKGNIRRGTQMLTTFVSNHSPSQPLYAEAVIYRVLTMFYLQSAQKETWEYLTSKQFTTNNNLLNAFTKATIALDYRKADAAMETLQEAAANPDYASFPIFDYQVGAGLLTRLDTACERFFYRYLHNNKSDLYVKDTWQKLAICSYVNNNAGNAAYCLGQVQSHGSTRLDADKQANKFAETGVWPPVKLLQARLLTEGGYHQRALTILQSIDESQLPVADKVEYLFRTARAWQEAGDNSKALAYYRSTIEMGKARHEQFAARAALQTGLIYERAGMTAKAMSMYKKCLDMPAHDFQNGIDQQAKAGINRINAR